MAIEKAKIEEEVSEEDKKEQLKNLKSNVKSIIEDSSLAMRELAILEKKVEIMKEHPKVLKPNFEFESEEAYVELVKEEWDISYEKQRKQIEFAVGENDKRMDRALDEIEKLEGEKK